MSRPEMDDDDELPRTWWQRHGVLVVVGVLLAGGGAAAYKFMSGPKAASRPEPMTMVSLPPPPPPPKPLPPPPPPKEQPKEEPEDKKMDELKPQDEPEQKPDPAPKAEEPAAPSTGIQGNGAPDGFGLGSSGGWGGLGRGGRGGGGGSMQGWYAGKVKSQVANALKQNAKTRKAALSMKVRLWPDAAGNTRVSLVESTGDAAMLAEARQELASLKFEAPPAGLKLPVNLRIVLERPR